MNRTIVRRDNYGLSNLFIGLLVALLLIFCILFSIFDFGLSLIQSLIVILVGIVMYGILIIVLLATSRNSVFVKESANVSDIAKEVVKEIDKNDKINEMKDKMEDKIDFNIPKYEYIGSILSKTYHKRTCRLGKLIKKKYKLSDNNVAFFKSKRFKPCKVCIKKKR